MFRTLSFSMLVLLFACTSKQDKMAAALSNVDAFLTPNLQLDKIPDSLSRKMHDFAMAYPQNPRSEEYLYRATQMAEMKGKFFETAKWCEDYTVTYPKGKYLLGAITAAAANYEKTGTYEKALFFYKRLYTEYPKSNLANDAKRTVEMINKGLVTPEQQLEYILNKNAKDSGIKNQ